jgi:hypothetical protein
MKKLLIYQSVSWCCAKADQVLFVDITGICGYFIPMNILLDIGHPGHVHLLRNSAQAWTRQGHKVIVSIRNKKIIRDLLTLHGFEYVITSEPRSSLLGLAWELLVKDFQVWRLTVKHKVDLILGTSVAAAHVSRITKAKSIVLNEDDADYVKLFSKITYPFADYVVTPKVLRDKKEKNYRCHDSYHELAYLHPDNFNPNPKVLDLLGVKPGEPFFLLRLVAFKAHHDVGQGGIDQNLRTRLLDYLETKGKVFITMEGDIPEDLRPFQLPIEPHLVHDAMHYAQMLISDSQTMTMEAAVLGTPAIRYNTFVGKCSVISELEDKFELALGFKPGEEEQFLAKIKELLDDPETANLWQKRRQTMLAEKVDLNQWLLNLVEESQLLRTTGSKPL